MNKTKLACSPNCPVETCDKEWGKRCPYEIEVEVKNPE